MRLVLGVISIDLASSHAKLRWRPLNIAANCLAFLILSIYSELCDYFMEEFTCVDHHKL